MVTLTRAAAIHYTVPVGGTAVLAQHEQSSVFWTTAAWVMVSVMVSILAEGVSATHLTRPC